MAAIASVVCSTSTAWADKVAVLPFSPLSSQRPLPKPELDEARKWTRDGVTLRGHTLPSDSEMLSGEMAVKDGVADTSQEYRAAGRASGSQWALTGRLERIDVPASRQADGAEISGYTVYRFELEACQVDSGRVESLARDVDPDDAPNQIGEMIGLLVRPEGLGNAEIPWKTGVPHKPKPKPKPAPEPAPAPPPPAPPPPPAEPVVPAVQHVYAEGHPFALGVSVGLSGALSRPSEARGPSLALPIGGVAAYALESVPGLEFRGIFTSQVAGPRALEISAGARWAFPLLARYRIFVGPELLAGAHVALGADKTARFLTHGSAFASFGVGERVQLEIAGDLAAAFGGTGTLVLGGGTARALVRF